MTLKRISAVCQTIFFSNTGRNLTLFVAGYERKKKKCSSIITRQGIKVSPVPNRHYLQTVGVSCLTIIGGSLTGLDALALAVTFRIKVLVASPSLFLAQTS